SESQQLSTSKFVFQPFPKYPKLWFSTKFSHAVICSKLSSILWIDDAIYIS
ncbi:unnamed protein product, partial [Arabidopsis halleri]